MRFDSLWMFFALVVAGVLLLGNAVPADADPVSLCAAQRQALDEVNVRIQQHNAQPHVFTLPEQQAQAQAYDSEASALNAEGATAQANLRSCLQALYQPIGVKPGWTARQADDGNGIVWQEPGAYRNSNSLRITFPGRDPRYPNGYVRFYNRGNQPIGLDGKPGSEAHTHIPRNPDGTYPLPKGW